MADRLTCSFCGATSPTYSSAITAAEAQHGWYRALVVPCLVEMTSPTPGLLHRHWVLCPACLADADIQTEAITPPTR